jgi:hypothetical protein
MSTSTPSSGSTWFWNGSLSLPSTLTALGVSGLWFDTSGFSPVLPDPGNGVAASLPQGWQSLGNGAAGSAAHLYPNLIANNYYNFPLSDALWGTVPTNAIGLIEPGVGTALPSTATQSFAALVDAYRAGAGITTPVSVTSVANGGQEFPPGSGFTSASERSLDVGVVTTINPLSPLILYAGASSHTDSFTTYQSAIWDTANNPQVLTSSFSFPATTAPGSPFYIATQQLFIDAALRNISVFSDNGDLGSGDKYGNGFTNVTRESPFSVMVGGTSLSTLLAAIGDPTLNNIVALALAGDPATIWQLVAGGLTSMPNPANENASLIETVWNQYYLSGTTIATPGGLQTGFFANHTGAGGVDANTPVPPYQSAFGLTPTTSDPNHLVGRVRECRRQHVLPYSILGFDKHSERRRHERFDAALGLARRAIQCGLPRPGPAESRLHERPSIHRHGHRAGVVQRCDPGQQHLVFHLRWRVHERWCRHHADRLRLSGRPRLRPHDGIGLAQRLVADARAHRHRPFADVVRLGSRADQLGQPWRLDQRCRPDPVVPDHVRRRHRCRRA